MMFLVKLIGAAILAGIVLVGITIWDLTANGGRLFYRLAGRDTLVQDCTPPLRENLIGKGFSPTDIAFGDDPSISFVSGSYGRSRSLSGAFTFSDGADGPRVDGHVLCTFDGRTTKVEVRVDELPRRVT